MRVQVATRSKTMAQLGIALAVFAALLFAPGAFAQNTDDAPPPPPLEGDEETEFEEFDTAISPLVSSENDKIADDGKTAADNEIVEDKVANDKIVEDKVADDKIVEDKVADDKVADDKIVEDKVADDIVDDRLADDKAESEAEPSLAIHVVTASLAGGVGAFVSLGIALPSFIFVALTQMLAAVLILPVLFVAIPVLVTAAALVFTGASNKTKLGASVGAGVGFVVGIALGGAGGIVGYLAVLSSPLGSSALPLVVGLGTVLSGAILGAGSLSALGAIGGQFWHDESERE